MNLDRIQLDDALSPFGRLYSPDVFVWGKENDEHFKLDTIVVNSLGKVEIPLKKEIVSNLIDDYKTSNTDENSNQCKSKSCEIKDISIPHIDEIKQSLKHSAEEAIRKQFEIGSEKFNFDTDVILKSLVICEPSEIHEEILTRTCHGVFGTLLLHLPVESNLHVEAKLKISYGGKAKDYMYEKKSPFYLTFVAGNRRAIDQTKVRIEAFNEHAIAVLVFDLVWLDSFGIPRPFETDVFPDILRKTRDASQALNGWRKLQESQRKKIKNVSDSGSWREIPLLNAKFTRTLYIPARHSYLYHDFRMDKLKRDDAHMAHILKAIPYIDVTLVILRMENRRLGKRQEPLEKVDTTSEEDDSSTTSSDSSDESEPVTAVNGSSLKAISHELNDSSDSSDSDSDLTVVEKFRTTYKKCASEKQEPFKVNESSSEEDDYSVTSSDSSNSDVMEIERVIAKKKSDGGLEEPLKTVEMSSEGDDTSVTSTESSDVNEPSSVVNKSSLYSILRKLDAKSSSDSDSDVNLDSDLNSSSESSSDDFSSDSDSDSDSFEVIDWKKTVTEGRYKAFEVCQRIHGDWVYPVLYWDTWASWQYASERLVGDVALLIEDMPFEAQRQLGHSRYFSYHPAFIIRPRHEAITNCWEHSPVRTLQCLTQRFNLLLNRTAHGNESTRFSLLQDANFIVDLVAKKGKRLNDCKRTVILQQLLYIFTRLKAVDEALKVVALIPERQCKCTTTHKVQFDEFFDQSFRIKFAIAGVIVDLVSIAGWERCSSALCALFSRRKGEDHITLSFLSSSFTHYGWIEPAVIFTKRALEEFVAKGKFAEPDEDFDLYLESDEIIDSIKIAEMADRQSRLEIYELLGKAREFDVIVLEFMIEHFFSRLNDGGEKLEDLKSSITCILSEMYIDGYSADVFREICFLQQTQNTELSEKLWTRLLFPPEDANSRRTDFEDVLMYHGIHEELEFFALVYKAIAARPLAKERFYKFIESQKTNTVRAMELQGCCAFHLTMAEREPGLADEHRLNSFCSFLKKLGLHWLVELAEFVVKHNENEDLPPISKKIHAALLDAMSRSNPSRLICEKSDALYHFVRCYVKLGNNTSTLALANKFHPSFNGNFQDPTSAAATTEINKLLSSSWLTCLKEKLADAQSNASIIVHQILNFFKFYFTTKSVNPKEAKVADLDGDLSQLLTFEFLEKFLTALYEREREQAPECLKGNSLQWNVSQVLSDLLATHPKVKEEFAKFETERIAKVMCCIFWLGSKVANERFAHLVCTVPFSSTSTCLSLALLSDDKVQNCAMGSPFAFSALQKMVRHFIRCLFFEADSSNSWSREDVTLPNYPEVEAFYHSKERSKSFGPFKNVGEANSFGKTATKSFHWAHHVISKTGSSIFCEITKLYPARLDANHSLSVPSMCRSLCSTYNRLFSEKSRAEEISKHHKCVACITPSLG